MYVGKKMLKEKMENISGANVTNNSIVIAVIEVLLQIHDEVIVI